MSRKTKKNSNKKKLNEIEIQEKHQFIGAIILVISILFFVSLLSNEMGVMGSLSRKSFYFIFGRVSHLFCLILALSGFVLLLKISSRKKLQYISYLLCILLSTLVLIEIYTPYSIAFEDRILRIDSYPVDAGLIGNLLGTALKNLFGKVGTSIAIFLILAFGLLFIISKEDKQNIQNRLLDYYNKAKKAIENRKVCKNKESNKDIPVKTKRVQKNHSKSKKDLVINDYIPSNISNSTEDINKKVMPLKEEEKIEFQKELSISEGGNESYILPPFDLLNPSVTKGPKDLSIIKAKAKIIEDTMENFNIDCRVTAINHGPSITCYEVQPAPGVRLNRIVALADNLSLSLASPEIRIEAPIPGKSAVGIEVPNKNTESVGLREILESSEFKNLESKAPLTLGKDVSGKNIVSSIEKMPHLLIAGATGSGKSVCINTILISILYKSNPNEVKLILIDPKVVELGVYNEIPHLLIPVVTDPKKAAFALSWAVDEMEKRYKKFAESGVRDIKGYNNKVNTKQVDGSKMPKIVIVVDELSDLMMVAAKEVEDYITRLAQMARAAGIHLILATQRPSVDVITGTIKANIPSRIAFSVSSQIDSRTILDMGGAEKLLGKGDMLFYPSSYPKPKRIQGAFVSDDEVESIINFIKENSEKQDYHEEALESMESKEITQISDQDPLLDEAIKIVLVQEQASISFLQRKLKVGYSRAARIVDQMEEIGVIGPHEGSKPRKLLLSGEEIKNFIENEENND